MKYFNLDEYLNILEKLVNIDSNSFDKEGVDRVADILEKLYSELGVEVNRYRFDDRAGSCLEIRNHPESEGIDVMMVGHMDTVLPTGSVLERPFSCDGKIAYGPGVCDMKSGLLNIYYIFKELVSENTPLKLCVAINSDEEISSMYSNEWIRSLGKKSKYGLVFEAGRRNGAGVKERKGMGRFLIEFHGKYAHAGVNPQEGASAIHEMAYWITTLVSLNDYEKGTTVNIGTVNGGIGANVVAERAQFQLDIRYDDINEYEKIVKTLKKLHEKPFIAGVTSKITDLGFKPPMLADDITEKFIELMNRKGKDCGLNMSWVKTGGCSDGNYMAYEGCHVLDGLGPIGDGAHGDKEIMVVDSIKPRMEMVYQALKELEKEI